MVMVNVISRYILLLICLSMLITIPTQMYLSKYLSDYVTWNPCR